MEASTGEKVVNSEVDDIGSSLNQIDVDCQTLKKDEKLKAPHVGMIFGSIEEAKNYYEEYGRQEEFWIRTRTSSRTRWGSNEVTNKEFVCAREGSVSSNPNKVKVRSRSTIKCGCKAKMRVMAEEWTTQWRVSIFNDDHNHKLVTPSKKMKMKSNRCMPKSVMNLTEAFHRENLQVGKVASILEGAHIGFDDRDCYNHLRNVRYKKLEGGDAQSVLNYFRSRQAENPQFFYVIQCDEDGRAVNFFWVDPRSRMSYQHFGDVVTFDTTYRTNKYDMLFAPFIGVNHHYQSIQFGCALLQDETEVTFYWLFETWLKAMGGRPPIAIITDQDLAMREAIAKVFPNSRHRLCIWHIKKKFAEKLSQVYFKKSKFKADMKKCIWSTFKIEEFEDQWQKLIAEYRLEENEWLRHLYDIRDSWVPVFNHNTFMAGMNTTGRSEGINAFFDGFVTSSTNLKEFVIKYEQALNKIVKKESYEDFELEHKYRIVGEDEFLLKHAAQVYTRNIFKKFKNEWVKVKRYKVEEREPDDKYHTYVVSTKYGDLKEVVVKFNLQMHEGTCECKNFEFTGILCRHFLKVLFRLDIDSIPPHFILERWRKETNKFRFMDSSILNDVNELSDALRLSHLCQEATKLACFASTSNERYKIYLNTLKKLSIKLLEVKDDFIPNDSPVDVFENDHSISRSSQLLLLDPNVSQTKDRKRDEKEKENVNSFGRLKNGIELAQQKKKRKCALCHKLGHDKRICPINPNKKKNNFDEQLAENADELH